MKSCYACGAPAPPLLGEVKSRCFVGTEAEGPHRGKRVLFVPGTVTPAEFHGAYARAGAVDRTYLGAGNSRHVRFDTFLVACGSGVPVDLEVDGVAGLGWRVAGLTGNLVSCDPADHHRADYLKVVHGGKIYWLPGKGLQSFVTDVGDPLYAGDREI